MSGRDTPTPAEFFLQRQTHDGSGASEWRPAPTAQQVSESVEGTRSEPQAAAALAGALDRETVSRSAVRRAAKSSKASLLSADSGPARTASVDLSDGDPRDIARAMLPEFGFAADQFGCLDALWVSESDWRVDADNPTSSAYGIPQALTETHDMPAGYMTDATVQIRWGLGYIRDAYGTPCGAWSFKQGNGWY